MKGSGSNEGSSRGAVEIDVKVDARSVSVETRISGTAVLVTVAVEVVDAIEAVRLRFCGPGCLDLRL